MSVWADIRKKSLGQEARDEEKYLSDKQISKILESHKVGENGDSPIRMFFLLNKDDDDKIRMYSVSLKSCFHPDGSRDFNSEENIKAIMSNKYRILELR